MAKANPPNVLQQAQGVATKAKNVVVAGMESPVGKAVGKYAVPVAAAVTSNFGDDAIKVDAVRDPNAGAADTAIGAVQELALRAGDWGTKGVDMLTSPIAYTLNKGSQLIGQGEPFSYSATNDFYRDGMREGVQGTNIKAKSKAPAPTPSPQGATPAELIAAQPTAAAAPESNPAQEIAKNTITFGGKTVSLPEAAPVARDPNRQYDAHGNDMTRTNEMKAQLVGMQRERLMRDMGADITSQGTRVAAAQQLAQMDKDQGLQLLANRGAREDATAAMDQQHKGQQIAQLKQDADLKTKVMAGDPKAIEMWNRIHPKDQEEFGAVALKETDANGLVSERLAPYSKRTGLAPSGVAQQSNKPPSQADLEHTAKVNGITVEEVKARLAKLQTGGK